MQLTQRQFLFLDDLLHAEEIQSVTFRHMADFCEDPQLKQLCNQIAQAHQQHFDRLLSLLNLAQGGPAAQPGLNAQQQQPAPLQV